MSTHEVVEGAGGRGAPAEAGGHRPLLLEAGRAWVVRAGRIDVFATRLRGGQPHGARTHLFRVEAGGALFGVGAGTDGDTGWLAVGATGTQVAEVDPAEWRTAALRETVAERLHGWVTGVYAALADRPPPRFTAVGVDEEAEADTGAVLRPAGRVGWAQPLRGTLRLGGRADAVVGPGECLPVSGAGWLQATEPAALRFRATHDLLAADPGALWEGLERLHRLAHAGVAARLEADAAAERARLDARVLQGHAAMRAALARLAAPMAPASPAEIAMRLRPAGGGEDTLFAAFRLVAEAQGIDAVPEPAAGAAAGRDPLEALARAARVRTRVVALRGAWWRGDSGPLLGTLADGGRAVALVPSRRGYLLLDPATRTRVPVDETVAATLASFAHTLYRPFAPGAVGLAELVRFGLRGCRADLWTIVGVALAMALLGLVTPLAVTVLFDIIIPGAERAPLLQLTGVLLVCAVATAAFGVVRGVALLRVELRAGAEIQAAVWDRLLSLPLSFFRDYSAGDLATRAMGVEEIRRILSGVAVGALLNGLFSLVNFVLLVRYDARLALLAAALLAVAVGATAAAGWLQLRIQRAVLRLQSVTAGTVLQLLTGIAKLKMAGAEVQAFGIWARLFGEQREGQFRVRTLGLWLNVFHAAFPLLCTLALFAAAAPEPGEEGPATGSFLGFLAAFQLCLSAGLVASGALVQAGRVVPLHEQLRPILHAAPEVTPGKADPGELSGALEVQHVTFRYGDTAPVLRDVSVHVRPGEFVAFVGPSGSGKSTLLRLLLGFETPEAGTVLYDGQDLAGLDATRVRRQIGVVLQSGRLMAGDLYTNIVGASRATLDEAWEAARMAELAEDIEAMPMKMHTVVSDGGGTLSGGQRQRLMIARAVVGRPRILFFDEATSALDNRTQALVSHSLERLKATRVVIAHRLSTVVNADRILVVQGGRIVESGTYPELLARDGWFAAMARRQLA